MSDQIREKVEKYFSSYPAQTYPKDSVLIDPSEEMRQVFYIEKGYVRMFSISDEGVEVTLHIFEKGAFFSLMWALNDEQNRCFFDALTEVEVRLVPKEEIVAYLQREQDVLFDLSKRLLRGLSGLLWRVEQTLTGNVQERVISALLYLAKHFGERNGKQVTIQERFTHRDIAMFVGSARETTSIELEKLKREGLVETGKLITLLDIEELEAMLKK